MRLINLTALFTVLIVSPGCNPAATANPAVAASPCFAPAQVDVLIDKTGSANRNRTPEIQPEQFDPLYERVSRRGGKSPLGCSQAAAIAPFYASVWTKALRRRTLQIRTRTPSTMHAAEPRRSNSAHAWRRRRSNARRTEPRTSGSSSRHFSPYWPPLELIVRTPSAVCVAPVSSTESPQPLEADASPVHRSGQRRGSQLRSAGFRAGAVSSC